MDDALASGEVVDLSIVIVSWNVRDLLRRCLLSLCQEGSRHQPPLGFEVTVVDSASSDGSVEMVQREFPWVRLIPSHENLGYARGNNLGMEGASGRYRLVLNPDTEVVGEALSEMVRYMDQHPAVGALGPALRYPDGNLQSSRRRFPTLATAFCESTLLHQWFPYNRVARYYHLADRPPDVSQPVDWLVGAALMLRRQAWQQVGPLDEGFFMYFEELDWCRRCRAAGWEIHYFPDAEIIHYEGKSSEQVATHRTIRFQRSKIRYYRKYYGASWALIIRLFLLATFAFQFSEETLKWLVGHKRGLRRQRMASYWRVLRSGLTTDGSR
jgi:N-acetylglucosaminyl-diphospho-decaprenol L-rhamnosyltransferase